MGLDPFQYCNNSKYQWDREHEDSLDSVDLPLAQGGSESTRQMVGTTPSSVRVGAPRVWLGKPLRTIDFGRTKRAF